MASHRCFSLIIAGAVCALSGRGFSLSTEAARAPARGAAPALPLVDDRSTGVTLRGGVQMPWISNGAWDLHHTTPDETEAMLEWISLGGRGLDTAYSYGAKDQTGMGAAVGKASVPREDLFLTTKIPCAGNASGAMHYIQQDLAQLKLSYVDLLLIHEPTGCKTAAQLQETWKGLEEALEKRLTRAIGVSNFEVPQLKEVLATAVTPPAVNQCCMRVGVHDDPTIAFCAVHDIVYQAYSPLGHGTNTTEPPVLLLPELKEMATKHNVSAAQVAFRFLTQVS
jgi:diketogulonate reductase-like aldo/keto reductase